MKRPLIGHRSIADLTLQRLDAVEHFGELGAEGRDDVLDAWRRAGMRGLETRL